MDTCSKIELTAIILTSCVFGLVALPASAARVSVPSIAINFQCESPDVVDRFVAAKFPRDVVVFEQALRDGVCTYSGTPIRVSPVRFVSTIAAGEMAAESIAYLWEVRYSDGNIGYTYLWSTQHDMMVNEMRTFHPSIGAPECVSARYGSDERQGNMSGESRRPTPYADAMCSTDQWLPQPPDTR